MINGSDVMQSIIVILLAVDDPPWGTKVYPAGELIAAEKPPFITVGVERSIHGLLKIPDDRRMETFQVSIVCVALPTNEYTKGILAGAVRDALTASKLDIKDHTTDPETPVLIDSRDIMDMEIIDTAMEEETIDIADRFSRYSKEINGFITIYQDKV